MAKQKPISPAKLKADVAVRLHRLAAAIDGGRVEVSSVVDGEEADEEFVEVRYRVLTAESA